MTEAPPNPFATHPNEDPDHLAARQARLDFAGRVQEIRDSRVWSDEHKAEQIAALYEQHVKEISDAYGRVTERRQARLDYLNGLVPSGPGIPDDASPADRAFLVQAFRSNLEQATNAPRGDLPQLLAEAERYGDDSMQRAVLQHASDSGNTRLINDWVARTHNVPGYSEERGQLHNAVNRGPGSWSGWDYKDFQTPAAPPEVRAAAQTA